MFATKSLRMIQPTQRMMMRPTRRMMKVPVGLGAVTSFALMDANELRTGRGTNWYVGRRCESPLRILRDPSTINWHGTEDTARESANGSLLQPILFRNVSADLDRFHLSLFQSVHT